MTAPTARKLFLAAPVFLLLGVIAMKFGWKGNDDLAWSVALPLWVGAHSAYVLGYLLFAPVLAVLWRRARSAAPTSAERAGTDVLAVVGAVGLVAMLGQMVIDLIVGFQAGSRAAMSPISQSFHDIPLVNAFFYGTIPALQLAATSLLIILLAVRRQITAWPALLFTAGAVCIGTQLTALMVLGGLALCVALPATVGSPAFKAPKRHAVPAS